MRVSEFSYVDQFFLNGSQFMYSLQSSAFSLFHFIFMWQCREGHCQIPLPSVRVRFSVLDEDYIRLVRACVRRFRYLQYVSGFPFSMKNDTASTRLDSSSTDATIVHAGS